MTHLLEIYGIFFEAAHLTSSGSENYGLHGHSFEVSLTIKGKPDPSSYMIIDSTELRRLVMSLTRKLDHAVIVGDDQRDLETLLDKNEIKVVVIPYPQATMEALAEYLAREIAGKLSKISDRISYLKVCVSQGPMEKACFENNSLEEK